MAAKGGRNGRGSGSGPGTRGPAGRPGARTAGARPAGTRATSSGARQAAAPPQTGLRAALVRRTGPFLVLLHRAPRWVPFGLVFALVLAGALLPEPAGGVALVVLALLLGWLLLLAWPALTQGGRAVRAASLVLVLVLAVTRLG